MGHPFTLVINNVSDQYIVTAIFGTFLVPVVEEIIFRGLLQKRLLVNHPWFSIFLSSIIFAICHFNYSIWILPTFLTGFFCGIIYYKTNKLIICILFHSLLNLMCSVFTFSFNHNLVLQNLTFVIAIAISIYAIRGIKRDKSVSPQNTNKNEDLN